MNQMCMRVDKSRQHHPSAHIHFFRGLALFQFFDSCGRTNRRNHSITHQYRAIANHANIEKRMTPPRPASPHGNNLRSAADQQRAAHRVLTPSPPFCYTPPQTHPGQTPRSLSVWSYSPTAAPADSTIHHSARRSFQSSAPLSCPAIPSASIPAPLEIPEKSCRTASVFQLPLRLPPPLHQAKYPAVPAILVSKIP